MWARVSVRLAHTQTSRDPRSLLLARAQQLIPDAVGFQTAEQSTKQAAAEQSTKQDELGAFTHVARALASASPPHWPAGSSATVLAIARAALDSAPRSSEESDRLLFHLAGLETRTLLAMTRALATAVAPEELAAELGAAAAVRAAVDSRETAGRPWTAGDREAAAAWQADPAADPVLEFEPRWLAVDFGPRVLRQPVICGQTAAGLALMLPCGRGDNDPGTSWLIQRAVAFEEPLVYGPARSGRREPIGVLVEDHLGYRSPAAPSHAEKKQILAAAITCIRTGSLVRIRQAPALLAAAADRSSSDAAALSMLAGLALTAPVGTSETRQAAAAVNARVLAADALLACCDPPPASWDPNRFFNDLATTRANLSFVAGVVALARGAGPMQVLRELAEF